MKLLIGLFWNQEERRLRTLWRLLAFSLLMFVVAWSWSVLVHLKLGNDYFTFPLLIGAATGLFFGGLWLAARFLDRRRVGTLGFQINRRWWWDAAFGFGLGAMLMAGVFVVESLAGWIEIGRGGAALARRDLVGGLVSQLAFCIAAGLSEEAISRGYVLRNLAEGLNSRRLGARRALVLAWLGSSALFGLHHLWNPGATLLSTLNLMFAGVLLGLPLVLTGSLAVPVGIHIAWNFFQGPVFGFPVSGSSFGSPLLQVTAVGPELWTGGQFGPEGGLTGLFASAVGALGVLWWVSQAHGQVVLRTRLAQAPMVADALATDAAFTPEPTSQEISPPSTGAA
jgi:hypothetical protein